MIELIFLELISLVSFIYALILLFFEFTNIDQLAGIFIWIVLSALIITLSLGKSKFHNLTLFLLLAPLSYFKGWNYIFLTLTSSIIILLYIQTSLQKGKYTGYVNMFKKSIILYVVLFYIKLVSSQFIWFLGKESIFLIIYLLSSIVLIRSIRHLDTNMDNLTIRNSNRKYIVSIVIVFLVGTFDLLRNILFNITNKAFELVEYLLYLLLYPLNKFLFWLFGLFQDMESAEQEIIIGPGEIPEDRIEPEVVEGFTEYVQKNFLILKIIASVILFIVVIYILYKLLSKTGEKEYIGAEYTEHREYIKDDKNKRRRLFGERYPKDPKEQIRYYYRKFLEKLNKEDIEILKQDTSLDINNKVSDKYGSDIEKIRDIYIENRYGNGNVDKDDVEIMKGLYRNL